MTDNSTKVLKIVVFTKVSFKKLTNENTLDVINVVCLIVNISCRKIFLKLTTKNVILFRIFAILVQANETIAQKRN